MIYMSKLEMSRDHIINGSTNTLLLTLPKYTRYTDVKMYIYILYIPQQFKKMIIIEAKKGPGKSLRTVVIQITIY